MGIESEKIRYNSIISFSANDHIFFFLFSWIIWNKIGKIQINITSLSNIKMLYKNNL